MLYVHIRFFVYKSLLFDFNDKIYLKIIIFNIHKMKVDSFYV